MASTAETCTAANTLAKPARPRRIRPFGRFGKVDSFALMVPTLPTQIVAYLALFATVGFLFVFASLLLGRFLRGDAPTPQKLEIYECGEPAVGPGTVQFDLRFYVAALLFLIFEVEVALFFPPAVVFGKASKARASLAKQIQGQRHLVPRNPEIPKSRNPQLSTTRRWRTQAKR